MRIIRTEEQGALTDIVRDLVASASPPERVAEVADGPDEHDEPLWRRLSDEIGVTGLLVPERFGGADATWREVAAVVSELGRALACVPYVSSSVLAVTAILGTGDERAARALLPEIASGGSVATVAAADPAGAVTEEGISVTARVDGDGVWRLDGTVGFVPDAAIADVIVVLARTEEGPTWFTVSRATSPVGVQPVAVLDHTRPYAAIRFEATPADLLGGVGEGWCVAEQVIDAATVALACEQLAASEHLLELSVAYACERLQFGQPIGSFQAIQHKLADLAVLVDEARSAVEFAVWAAADQPVSSREAASLAGVVCGEAARTVAAEAIQVHGGIGFTWEHVAHRYLRRAYASAAAFLTPEAHRERVLDAIGVTRT